MTAEFPCDFRFDAVWPLPTEEVCEQVVRFWLSEGAMADEVRAKTRARQLVSVVWTCDQKIAAVSTVRKVHVRQLALGCFYYRMFVGREHRVRGLRSTDLVRHILVRSYDVLNHRYQQGHDPDCVGLYLEVESESLKKNRNQTVWNDLGANVVYIGRTVRGAHARVWFFDGSRIPD